MSACTSTPETEQTLSNYQTFCTANSNRMGGVTLFLKRMGYAYKLVSHSLRSIASTALNEQGFDPELIETALAHIGKDQVRNAYNRAEYIEVEEK